MVLLRKFQRTFFETEKIRAGIVINRIFEKMRHLSMQQGLLGGLVAAEHAQQPEQEERGGSKTTRAEGKTKTTATRPNSNCDSDFATSIFVMNAWTLLCVSFVFTYICIYLTYDYYDVEFFWCQHVPLPLSYSAVQILPLQFFCLFPIFQVTPFCRDNENVNEQIRCWQLLRWPI